MVLPYINIDRRRFFLDNFLASVPLFSRLSSLCASEPLFQVKSLVFDQSGTYLAVGGSDIRVYICKQWSEVLNFTGEAVHPVCTSYGVFVCVCSEEVADV